MQKTYSRRAKTVVAYSSQESEQILHFSLQDALPDGHTFALNKAFGTFSYLVCNERSLPRLMRQEQFTSTEMSVLLPMLEMFPYYCPYEVLYAHFYSGGKATDAEITRARKHLEDADVEGIWEQEMRPIRCALSRTRLKIRAFGIDISSILATGYILMVSHVVTVEDTVQEEREETPTPAPKWRQVMV
jgi:hypothetical protein